MSILVVDDSPDQQVLLSTILKKAGYQDLLVADSASAAYDALGITHASTSDRPPSIDLILMDFLMPGTDGVAATRHIKSLDLLRDIPVIVITAKQLTTIERDHLLGQAKKVISKGVLTEVDIVGAIGEAVRRRPGRADAAL